MPNPFFVQPYVPLFPPVAGAGGLLYPVGLDGDETYDQAQLITLPDFGAGPGVNLQLYSPVDNPRTDITSASAVGYRESIVSDDDFVSETRPDGTVGYPPARSGRGEFA